MVAHSMDDLMDSFLLGNKQRELRRRLSQKPVYRCCLGGCLLYLAAVSIRDRHQASQSQELRERSARAPLMLICF